jgi:hypothetical protein
MAIVVNGDGNITGLTAGGLPDASITQADLAAGVVGNGPAFSAYAGTNQTISNSTDTKIQINIEEFDTNSNYDTTNYRFTPTVSGYYQVSGASNFAASATGLRNLMLFKNGALYKTLQNVAANSTDYMNPSGSCLVFFNGTTDYVELYVKQSSGGSLATSASTSSQIWFQAAMVRSA